MTTAIHIADWLVRYRAEEAAAPIDAMSLEKHLYYAQGFYLATEHEPLFADDIQAWRFGPVVPAVYQRYKNFDSRAIEQPAETPAPLPNKAQDFLYDLSSFLARHNALELSDATHAEEPWLKARGSLRRWDSSETVIPVEEMANYFVHLIDEGEDALSAYALLDRLPAPDWGWKFAAGVCARRMVRHPFYLCGIALWNEKLWERPAPQPSISRDFFKPPVRSGAAASKSFSTLDEYRKLREAERLAAAE